MNRVLGAARMHLMHPALSVGVPWAIVLSSFAINLGVWGLGDVGAETDGAAETGGLASLYITVLVVFVQAVTQMFPFAMGLSLSRRDFYLGTALTAGVTAVGYGVALTVLAGIEKATDGWGMQLAFWAPAGLDVGNPALQVVVYALPMLACAFAGMGIGVVFKRWGTPGMYALALGTLLLVGLTAVWLTWREVWTEFGGWLADLSVADVTITLPIAVAAALAALTFLGLRRAVP
ncbi:hypothetical protein [Modestobacter versicolor]|uniref:Uncharacterized protein n=1 Tax=Modestobacter versicolor TaxID=429133 RepID=A0A323VHT2_9ACTN|nr:hypothetical protein [Modestobacter versicolor]MBB3677171.1 hypothetical protein [Modestobacter versicolor]PZA19688.1 hypothetical protein DMO24_19385 [Modestobacter versicolor]